MARNPRRPSMQDRKVTQRLAESEKARQAAAQAMQPIDVAERSVMKRQQKLVHKQDRKR